jgi:hypothetical protein
VHPVQEGTTPGYGTDMLVLIASALAAPPSWSMDLADVDSDLRDNVDRVMLRLRARGFDPRASCTFRSSEVQDTLFAFGGSTKARGGQSCHNHTSHGEAASWAVDLWDGGLGLGLVAGRAEAMDAQVPFLNALGDEGRAEGLVWGGTWRGRSSAWTARGLGWDPAHLQDSRCRG